MPHDELLTVAQVAKRWQVSRRTIERYIADGRLKAMKLPGRGYRIRAEDADAALGEIDRPSPPEQ